MPSGNESGADTDFWIPGGKTHGGISEAVINESNIDKDSYKHVILGD